MAPLSPPGGVTCLRAPSGSVTKGGEFRTWGGGMGFLLVPASMVGSGRGGKGGGSRLI